MENKDVVTKEKHNWYILHVTWDSIIPAGAGQDILPPRGDSQKKKKDLGRKRPHCNMEWRDDDKMGNECGRKRRNSTNLHVS